MSAKPYMADVLFPGAKKPVRAIVVPFEGAYVAEICDEGEGIYTKREMIEDDGRPCFLRVYSDCQWRETTYLLAVSDRALEAARALLPAADDDGDAALDRKRDDEIDKEAK